MLHCDGVAEPRRRESGYPCKAATTGERGLGLVCMNRKQPLDNRRPEKWAPKAPDRTFLKATMQRTVVVLRRERSRTGTLRQGPSPRREDS